MKRNLLTVLALLALLPTAVVYASSYTGPGNRTNISAEMIVRTQCLSTQYEGYNPVWRYRDWDGAYAAPGSAQALQWQANYPYAPEHTHCHSGLNGQYGWGEKTVNAGSYAPVSTASSLACGMPGENGWCRGNLALTLSATEPIPGYDVRRFDNDAGVICNPANAPSITCTAPITQQGSHSGDFWALSTYGDTSYKRSYSWSLDSVAPSLLSNVSGSPTGGWHTSDVGLNLSAADDTSGVNPASFRYQVNGGGWQNGTSLSVTVDGIHHINTEVRDMAGNSATRSITIQLDKTPPGLSPVSTGLQQNGWYRSLVETAANATDATSGVASVEHRINGGVWQTGGNVTISADGSYTVTFRVTDHAGHITTHDVSFSVDRTPPVVTQVVPAPGGANGWYTADVMASLSASDLLSGLASDSLRYRIDTHPWTTGNSVSIAVDGVHVVEARADDMAGNTGSTSFLIHRDTTPPTVTISVPGGWINTPGTASVTASDATSGLASVEHRIGNDAWQPGTSANITNEGVHDVTFRASDNAGLVTMRSANVRIDLTPPSISGTISPDGRNGWYITHPTILLLASDALSGIAPDSLAYRLNGGAWSTGASLAITEDGQHTIEARVSDLAANTAGTIFTAQVDTTAPDLEISVSSGAPQQNGWHVEPALAQAIASDATSGVALVEYRAEAHVGRSQSGWESGDHLLLEDGDHLVWMRVTDLAGNQTVKSRRVGVDMSAPVSTFEAIHKPLSGLVVLNGKSVDILSGVKRVEYSLDEGETWKTVAHVDEDWFIPFDTTTSPDGRYAILVRATDWAGNAERLPARLEVSVSNAPPKVSITQSWWIWESGHLSARPGVVPLADIRLEIACGSLPNVRLEFKDEHKLPAKYTWNRRCGDGVLAAPGKYPVTLTACDIFGRCASASGLIQIPAGVVLADPTPTATSTRPDLPSPTPPYPLSTPTARAQAAPPTSPAEVPPLPPAPIPWNWPLWLLPGAAILGTLVAFGINQIHDPRPAALRRLGAILERSGDGAS